MQTSTILGVIVGCAAVCVGMIFKGAHLSALVNPAALMIIFVGTTAALMNAFPMKKFLKIGSAFRLVFFGSSKLQDYEDIAIEFVNLSQIVRKEGVLSLEKRAEETTDPFLRNGMSMVADAVNPQVLREVLESQIEAMQDRHKDGALIFAQAGMYAPTLGVLGAVIGLVAALGNLNDIEKLGHSIAAAFIATMFGIFTGYVLWHPFSNKLKQMSKEEVARKSMVIEGLLSLEAGDPPSVVEMKMLAYIPEKQQYKLREKWDKARHG